MNGTFNENVLFNKLSKYKLMLEISVNNDTVRLNLEEKIKIQLFMIKNSNLKYWNVSLWIL